MEDSSTRLIYRGTRYAVTRTRRADGPVVVKTLLYPGSPGSPDFISLQREYRLLRSLELPGIARALALEEHADRPALVLADAGEQDLGHWLRQRPLPVSHFFKLALDLTETVVRLHRQGVVHRDVSPPNVVVYRDDRLTLVDFDAASPLDGAGAGGLVPRGTGGGWASLRYLPPEETGRTDRLVDHRADLYGLGATFYEMLTGTPPFSALDPVELVHAHLARAPAPPDLINPAVSPALSALVLRLLAKMPEARHASAEALLRDLRAVRPSAAAVGGADPRATADMDGPGSTGPAPNEPDAEPGLHGRQQELAQLLAAWDRTAAGGSEALLLVGEAGVGKSTLARELEDQVSRRGGRVLSARFAPRRSDGPYGPLLQALRELVRQLAQEGDDGSSLAGRVTAALGNDLWALTRVVPQLESLFQRAPPALAPEPAEAQQRFWRAFVGLIRALGTRERPLLLFLDDLQWADPESQELVQTLLASPAPHVLLLLARRPGTAEDSDPTQVRQQRATLLPLGDLDAPAVIAMTAELLSCDRQRAKPLGELLWQKTGGNPLFCRKLIGSLQASRLLRYDPERNRWSWQLSQIAELEVTDNVADLMVRTMRQLPEQTREALALVACVGHQAPLSIVAGARAESEADTRAALEPAVREGHLCPRWAQEGPVEARLIYQFAHDRVLEVAYSLVSPEQRRRLHAEVGRQLLQQARRPGPAEDGGGPHRSGELGDEVFAIIDQLRVAQIAKDDPPARRELAELCLCAARRAQLCYAFGAELSYLRLGLDLLPGDAWSADYPLALALHAQAMESAFVNGDPELGQALFERARREASSREDKAGLYQSRAAAAAANGDNGQVGRLVSEALELFGITVPSDPSEAAMAEALAENARDIGSRTIEQLVDSPRMEDPGHLRCMQLLALLSLSTYFEQPRRWPLVLARMVSLSLRHGNAGPSAQAYVAYGVLLLRRTGDHRLAERFGRMGVALSLTFDDPREQCRAAAVFAASLAPWTEPLRQMTPGLRRTLRLGMSGGDRMYAVSVAVTLAFHLFHQGGPLTEVRRELEAALVLTDKAGMTSEGQRLLALRRVIQRLAEGSSDRTCVEATEEEQASCRHLITRLAGAYLLGELEEARRLAADAQALIASSPRAVLLVELNFYESLTLARWCDRQASDVAERQQLIGRIVSNQTQLGLWADSCPDNFRHKHLLVAAELARITGQSLEAAELYDQTVEMAARAEFHQDAALAAELAARFHRGQGRKRFSRQYLAIALEGYQRWGAEAKRRALEAELSDLRGEAPWPTPGSAAGLATGGSGGVDLRSLTRASEVIVSEVVLDRLCARLMEVGLALAGAERGALLVREDGRLFVRASGVVGSAPSMERRPADTSPLIPLAVREWVQQSEDPLVIGDATQDPDLNSDPGVIARRVRSILAVPILHQGRLGGLLYLEHSASTRAFTPERIRLLQLLSSQIAIALSNSQLFERLTAEIRDRSRAEASVRFLAEAGVILGGSLDYPATLNQVVQLAVPGIADWCVLDLLDAQGRIHRVAAAHRDPTLTDRLRDVPFGKQRWASELLSHEVLEAGRAVLIPEASAATLERYLEEPEVRDLVRQLGLQSGMTVPLLAHGRTLGALTFSSSQPGRRYDSNDLVLAEELARRAAMAIENARLYRDAQQAIRLREEFLAVASHELNTPITSLRLLTEGLRDHLFAEAPEDMRRAVTIIERQARRLSALVQDLLDVAHLQAGHPPLHLEATDLVSIVRQAVAIFPMRAETGPLEVRAPAPIRGRWDRARIEQIVTNLLSNAVKFGSGKPVTVSIEPIADRARLTVADQGIGIEPERLPHVFDRFERAVPETHYGGLGLGLYIVREVVRALGGSVAVESVVGCGSCFTIDLPVQA